MSPKTKKDRRRGDWMSATVANLAAKSGDKGALCAGLTRCGCRKDHPRTAKGALPVEVRMCTLIPRSQKSDRIPVVSFIICTENDRGYVHTARHLLSCGRRNGYALAQPWRASSSPGELPLARTSRGMKFASFVPFPACSSFHQLTRALNRLQNVLCR